MNRRCESRPLGRRLARVARTPRRARHAGTRPSCLPRPEPPSDILFQYRVPQHKVAHRVQVSTIPASTVHSFGCGLPVFGSREYCAWTRLAICRLTALRRAAIAKRRARCGRTRARSERARLRRLDGPGDVPFDFNTRARQRRFQPMADFDPTHIARARRPEKAGKALWKQPTTFRLKAPPASVEFSPVAPHDGGSLLAAGRHLLDRVECRISHALAF